MMLLGLDYILTPEQNWVFLEANDHSNGLKIANSFSDSGQCSLGISNPLSNLWSHIKNCANGDLVVALLPDRFVGNGFITKSSIQNSKHLLTQENINIDTIEELEWYIENLKLQGVNAVLQTASSLHTDIDGLITSTEEVVGFILRRAMRMPRNSYFTPSLNDIRSRIICLDKLYLYAKIKQCKINKQVLIPETAVSSEKSVLNNYLASLQARSINYIILKKRYGSQSEDITRIQENSTDFYENMMSISGCTPDLLFQDFIDSDKIVMSGGHFSFDVRVFTFNGELIGGYIRKAAAPTKQPFIDSPLSWLTTFGTLHPISNKLEIASGIKLDGEIIKSLKKSAVAVSELADYCLKEISVDDTIKWLSDILPPRPLGNHFFI